MITEFAPFRNSSLSEGVGRFGMSRDFEYNKIYQTCLVRKIELYFILFSLKGTDKTLNYIWMLKKNPICCHC